MDGPDRAGSFFGRRKGKALRPGHDALVRTLLPRLRIELPTPRRALALDALFPRPVESVRIEIGFGGGEHLAHEARTHSAIGYLGCEPFINGTAKLLAALDAEGLDNVRLFDRDATELLPILTPASIDRVDLLFPDPWPKRRQRKRRFVSDENLAALARVLRPGGELRFATDIDDYAGWTLARVLRSPDFVWPATGADAWRQPWAGWPGTRYEAKAHAQGRGAAYLTFRRV